jgi:hypothetical protein
MAISYSGCTCGAGGGGGGECECPPTCVTTTCVLRCDDTNGDGQPDTTYSELWCIKQDGTSQLVVIYQDDPSTPYTPVAPVDCEQGTMQCHTEMLCDDSGRPFLRKFTFLSDGTAAYVDVEVDGETPHLVVGDVRSCDGGSDCADQRAPLATLGLCLADGTPIAAIVTRDCDGIVRQEGWVNLVSGVFSAGQPPVGTVACGEPRSVSTGGTFCDIDPASGTVFGLVLIEYTYNSDGSVSGVRLINAATGQTYTPQGEITTCPAGVTQPEKDLVVLCDTLADGSVRRFLRDYARDENGQITGHTDYTPDGSTYPVAGTVGFCDGDCGAQNIIQADRCDDTDGDGIADTWYIELLGVDCQGTVSTLGTYLCDLSGPYTPLNPVDCDADDDQGAPAAFGAQVRRRELAPGQSWDAASTPLIHSVTAIAHDGTGAITTADGTSTLRDGETATWSLVHDGDASLTGPLTITATDGTVIVNYTQGVRL